MCIIPFNSSQGLKSQHFESDFHSFLLEFKDASLQLDQ